MAKGVRKRKGGFDHIHTFIQARTRSPADPFWLTQVEKKNKNNK